MWLCSGWQSFSVFGPFSCCLQCLLHSMVADIHLALGRQEDINMMFIFWGQSISITHTRISQSKKVMDRLHENLWICLIMQYITSWQVLIYSYEACFPKFNRTSKILEYFFVRILPVGTSLVFLTDQYLASLCLVCERTYCGITWQLAQRSPRRKHRSESCCHLSALNQHD